MYKHRVDNEIVDRWTLVAGAGLAFVMGWLFTLLMSLHPGAT